MVHVEKIFAGYVSDIDKAAWKRVLLHIISTFEDNKKKGKQESVFYRPSWFDNDLFLPIFEFKIDKSNSGWEIQVAKTSKQLKFKSVDKVPVAGYWGLLCCLNITDKSTDIKALFGYKDKVPVVKVRESTSNTTKAKGEDKKGKRKADDMEPEEIQSPIVDVLGYLGAKE